MKQKYRIARLDELTEHPLDNRQGDVGLISMSIEQNGWYGAIIVQAGTGIVCAGNHRLRALRALGEAKVPIIELDCDDDTALAILLVDNASSDAATYDDAAHAEVLRILATQDKLAGTGYEPDDVDAMLRRLNADVVITPPVAKTQTCPACGHEFAP